MVSEPIQADDTQRLHPSTLLFTLGRALRNLIVPALVAFVSGRGSMLEMLFFVLFALVVSHAVIRYFTLRWQLTPEELVVREGVLFKQERHVPYARIQNVDLVQSVFHRMFGVAEVRVETASGETPEAVLQVLALDDAERLRARLKAPDRQEDDTASAAEPVEGSEARDARPDDVVVRVPPAHLVLLGIVLNRGLAVIGAGLGLLYELNAFEAFFRALGIERRFDSLSEAGLGGAVAAVVVLALFAVFALLALSVVWSLLRFWGFTLVSAGRDLRVSCGLLTHVSASIPTHRIQALRVTETLLQRVFDFASVAAQTAGGRSGDEGTANLARRRFVPILPVDDVPRVVDAALPHLGFAAVEWQALAPTATRRLRRRYLLGVGLLALPLPFVTPLLVLAAVPMAGVAWWYAGAAVRRMRWARTSGGIVWRRGVFTRRTSLLPAEKVQTVRIASSPFDRRHDHVTLIVDAAGGAKGSAEIKIRYLDRTVAEGLRNDLAITAAATEYMPHPREAA